MWWRCRKWKLNIADGNTVLCKYRRDSESNPYICPRGYSASPRKETGTTAGEAVRAAGACVPKAKAWGSHGWGDRGTPDWDQGLARGSMGGHCGRRALRFRDSFLSWVGNVLWSLRYVIWSLCDSALCLKQYIKGCFSALVRCHERFVKGTSVAGYWGLVSVTIKCCYNMLIEHF